CYCHSLVFCLFGSNRFYFFFFFFQAEDGIRDFHVTGVQTCALPISLSSRSPKMKRTSAPHRICVAPKGLPCTAERAAPGSPARRSEERRVGKECRSRWSAYEERKAREMKNVETAKDTARYLNE